MNFPAKIRDAPTEKFDFRAADTAKKPAKKVSSNKTSPQAEKNKSNKDETKNKKGDPKSVEKQKKNDSQQGDKGRYEDVDVDGDVEDIPTQFGEGEMPIIPKMGGKGSHTEKALGSQATQEDLSAFGS